MVFSRRHYPERLTLLIHTPERVRVKGLAQENSGSSAVLGFELPTF